MTNEGIMEQVNGIEPSSSAWKADALTVVLHLLIPISLGLRPTFTDGILVCVIPVLSQHIQVHTGSRPFCCVIFHLFMAPSALGSRTPLLAYSKTRPRGPYYRSGLNIFLFINIVFLAPFNHSTTTYPKHPTNRRL